MPLSGFYWVRVIMARLRIKTEAPGSGDLTQRSRGGEGRFRGVAVVAEDALIPHFRAGMGYRARGYCREKADMRTPMGAMRSKKVTDSSSWRLFHQRLSV